MRGLRGRPKSVVTKDNRMTIRLSEFEKLMLDELCGYSGQSASDVVRRALDLYYKQTHFYDFDEYVMDD